MIRIIMSLGRFGDMVPGQNDMGSGNMGLEQIAKMTVIILDGPNCLQLIRLMHYLKKSSCRRSFSGDLYLLLVGPCPHIDGH